MASKTRRIRVGVIGCGAIGSRIAISTTKELKDHFMISALYDIDPARSSSLAGRMRRPVLARRSVSEVLAASDLVVEAINTDATRNIVRQALLKKKSVLVMSVGRLLEEGSLFSLAERNRASLLIPSGAIAGLDAIKAARLAGIRSATLTTTKPPSGFKGSPYLKEKGIDPALIRRDTVIFEGSVRQAVRAFPQNINVAASLSLAVGDMKKVRVRIIASPEVRRNTHEIAIEGACGRIVTRVENEICPDNPKTSYLAVLSAIQALAQYARSVRIGS